MTTKECCSHLGHQLFLAVFMTAKVRWFKYPFPSYPAGMSGAMGQLVERCTVVFLWRLESFGLWQLHVIKHGTVACLVAAVPNIWSLGHTGYHLFRLLDGSK